MPRILRNYLISFAIIGTFLTVVHLIDEYMKAKALAERSEEQTQMETVETTQDR